MADIIVIIPVYKVEQYLNRCIDSVLNQTYQNFEILLIDDGSPDNCGRICDEYALKDNRIHVIHQVNGGLSDARNAGLDWLYENSDCEWITFIDSDDWIHPQYLSIMFDAVKTQKTMLAICNYQSTDHFITFGEIIKPQIECMKAEEAYIFPQIAQMPAWAKLYHRTLWKKERFPIGKLYEDAYVTHKIIFASEKVATVSEKLYYYYINPDSIMHKKWSPRRLEEIDARKSRLLDLEQSEYILAYQKDLESMLWMLLDQFSNIPNGTQYECYRKIVKKDMISYIRKCKHMKVKEKLFFYQAIFPYIFRLPYLISLYMET